MTITRRDFVTGTLAALGYTFAEVPPVLMIDDKLTALMDDAEVEMLRPTISALDVQGRILSTVTFAANYDPRTETMSNTEEIRFPTLIAASGLVEMLRVVIPWDPPITIVMRIPDSWRINSIAGDLNLNY